MFPVKCCLNKSAMVLLAVASVLGSVRAQANDGFPFGFEMTLDTAPQPGSKRLPTLEIGDNGAATLELWCKNVKGQFSVAGNTVVFVPGQAQEGACAPDRAEADDQLLSELTEATTWKRQGDDVFFVGTKSLHFQINTN
ncbi:MAG TPA: META domain-containing protein [Bradyrhizobium sp.]|nr:META domain-containing protein [Bradyrhizobium sp.]